MALRPTFPINPMFPCVGTLDHMPGKTVVFCNGIMNDFEKARSSATAISQAFGGRKVFIYHNPTTLIGYFDSSLIQSRSQTNLTETFARKIHELIAYHEAQGINNDQIRITLFVHSHGAIITKKALESLAILHPTDKDKIDVYSFGGATMIPNHLASKVHNYVFDADLIAGLGNLRNRQDMVLYQAKQIHQLMTEKRISRESAIIQQSYIDLHMELTPFSRAGRLESRQVCLDKNHRYTQIFEKKNKEALAADPYFRQRIEEYQTLFRSYHINILNGTPFQHPGYNEIKQHSNLSEFVSNTPGNLASGFQNFCKFLSAAGSHALINHNLSSYQTTVRRIAQEGQ